MRRVQPYNRSDTEESGNAITGKTEYENLGKEDIVTPPC